MVFFIGGSMKNKPHLKLTGSYWVARVRVSIHGMETFANATGETPLKAIASLNEFIQEIDRV